MLPWQLHIFFLSWKYARDWFTFKCSRLPLLAIRRRENSNWFFVDGLTMLWFPEFYLLFRCLVQWTAHISYVQSVWFGQHYISTHFVYTITKELLLYFTIFYPYRLQVHYYRKEAKPESRFRLSSMYLVHTLVPILIFLRMLCGCELPA